MHHHNHLYHQHLHMNKLKLNNASIRNLCVRFSILTALHHIVLPCPTLPCSLLLYLALPCHTLPCLPLPLTDPYPPLLCTALHCIALYCVVRDISSPHFRCQLRLSFKYRFFSIKSSRREIEYEQTKRRRTHRRTQFTPSHD